MGWIFGVVWNGREGQKTRLVFSQEEGGHGVPRWAWHRGSGCEVLGGEQSGTGARCRGPSSSPVDSAMPCMYSGLYSGLHIAPSVHYPRKLARYVAQALRERAGRAGMVRGARWRRPKVQGTRVQLLEICLLAARWRRLIRSRVVGPLALRGALWHTPVEAVASQSTAVWSHFRHSANKHASAVLLSAILLSHFVSSSPN